MKKISLNKGSVEGTTSVPTNISAFVNDSGYLTEHQSLDNYVTIGSAQNITSTKTFCGNSPNILIAPPNGVTTGTYSTIGFDGFTTRNAGNFFKTEYNTVNFSNKFGYKIATGSGTKYISIPDKTGTLAITDDIPSVEGLESSSNKATTITSSSTDIEYPSAKAVYSELVKLNTALETITQSITSLSERIEALETVNS